MPVGRRQPFAQSADRKLLQEDRQIRQVQQDPDPAHEQVIATAFPFDHEETGDHHQRRQHQRKMVHVGAQHRRDQDPAQIPETAESEVARQLIGQQRGGEKSDRIRPRDLRVHHRVLDRGHQRDQQQRGTGAGPADRRAVQVEQCDRRQDRERQFHHPFLHPEKFRPQPLEHLHARRMRVQLDHTALHRFKKRRENAHQRAQLIVRVRDREIVPEA